MVLSDLLECGSSRSSCKKCLYSHFQKFNFCSSKSYFNVWKVKIGHCFTYKRLFGVSLYEAAGFLECLEWEARNAQEGRRTLFTTSLVYHHCFLLKKKQKAEHQKLMAVKVVLAQRPSLSLSSFTFTIFSQIVCKVRRSLSLHFQESLQSFGASVLFLSNIRQHQSSPNIVCCKYKCNMKILQECQEKRF